jgi:N-acetyl-gamma-glutamyl-phosphate reductase
MCEIDVTHPPGDRVVVTVAIDNLVKGAAGQAIQAMNIMLGVDEAAGLSAPAVGP